MIDFVIKLAEIPIKVFANYKSSMDFCSEFLCEDEEKFSVRIDKTDLENEKIIAEKESADISPEMLEISAIYRKIAQELLDYDILLFHASAVSAEGIGVLFTADSGVGKTTHTKLWRDCFGEKVKVINGDKPLLKIEDNTITVFSSPWRGKEKAGENIFAPLRNICVIERDTVNRAVKSTADKELNILVRQIVMPSDAVKVKKTLELLDKLCNCADFYHIYCNTEKEAAETAYDAIIRKSTTHTVKGRSMLPFIAQQRDTVTISKPDSIEKFDVILYRRKNSKNVLHRVYKIEGERYYCVGDRENYGEWVEKADVIGVLIKVNRNGKEIKRGDKEFFKYAHLAYYSYPLRKMYLNIRRK